MTLDLARLLPAIRAVSEKAGLAILEVYNGEVTAKSKDDGSPVTAADEAAEAVILPVLAELTPEIPVISEESYTAGVRPAVGNRFWLVDPLDGTKEFIKRNGEFTVNIALVDDGVPVLGVVHVPVTGDTYAAAGVGTAVWGAPGRADRPIAVRTPPAEGLTVVSSRSHGDAEALEKILAGKKVADNKMAGSSLKFCLVARGDADMYPRLGPTMEWDTGAADAVLRGAGGRVVTEDGQPLRYGKEGFKNPFFFCHGA